MYLVLFQQQQNYRQEVEPVDGEQEEDYFDPEIYEAKRTPYSYGLGKRSPFANDESSVDPFGIDAYNNGIMKRFPYRSESGYNKREPYNNGWGSRIPYFHVLGKRTPYSYGLGKRTPYSYGLGK